MPDTRIYFSDMSPSEGPAGTNVTFSAPPDSFMIDGDGASKPVPLPPNTPLENISAWLEPEAGDRVPVFQCNCVDEMAYSMFSFVVPPGISTGYYILSANFITSPSSGEDVEKFEMTASIEFHVTGGQGAGRCEVMSVTPVENDNESVVWSKITYRGHWLSQIDASTVKVQNVVQGSIYPVTVITHEDNMMSGKMIGSGKKIYPGRYKLVVEKTSAALELDPEPVMIKPSSYFTLVPG